MEEEEATRDQNQTGIEATTEPNPVEDNYYANDVYQFLDDTSYNNNINEFRDIDPNSDDDDTCGPSTKKKLLVLVLLLPLISVILAAFYYRKILTFLKS
jgi:hypothetical protein